MAAIEALAPTLREGRSAAVLARTNRILDPVEAVCRSHGIKYYRASGKSILARPESALMCSLLEMAQRVRTKGLDAVLSYAGIGAQDLRTLHQKVGPSLEQRPMKDLVAFGLSEDSADRNRTLLKRLEDWCGLCDQQFYALVWDGVWIIRSEETVVPDEKSTESEERRLFYVAMTRARSTLYMSTAKKNPTSRFVLEAGLA